MNLQQFFDQNFNTQRDQWEKSLRSELKLEDASGKVFKKSAEGPWPTLSLDAPVTHQLHPELSWKKAAQSYVRVPADIEARLADDLASGVRLFFFEKPFLTELIWKKIATTLGASPKASEVVVFLLGDGELSSEKTSFSVVHEADLVSGRGAAATGGHHIQELALLTRVLIDREISGDVTLGVFLGSDFFRNIAKIRAARLLAQRVLSLRGISQKVYLLGLTNFREWTLYDRYSNILRNDVAVASGYIGGCDYVQSSGYQLIFDLETTESAPEHDERSWRMARNTSHILSLESALGVVEDASFGSYHLENLTEHFCQKAWELMQRSVPLSDGEVSDFFMKETAPVREERMRNFATRRHVLTGVNDFPDTKDRLSLGALPVGRFFRTARAFEELRLRMELTPERPDVYLAVYGDYAALNARMNFAKNYFELLGLSVTDPGKGQREKAQLERELAGRREKILVLVATDESYPELAKLASGAQEKFVACKVELPGYKNLFVGQNVYEVLSGIVARWGKK